MAREGTEPPPQDRDGDGLCCLSWPGKEGPSDPSPQVSWDTEGQELSLAAGADV